MAEQDLVERVTSPPSQQSPSDRSRVTRCPSCQLISTSRKLPLPQLATQSQISTSFECDSHPNCTWTDIWWKLAYFLYTNVYLQKWTLLCKCLLTCLKLSRTGKGDNLWEEQKCYNMPFKAFVPSVCLTFELYSGQLLNLGSAFAVPGLYNGGNLNNKENHLSVEPHSHFSG